MANFVQSCSFLWEQYTQERPVPMRAIKYVLAFCLMAVAGVCPVSGFTLLGPFAPWMTPRLSYHIGNDIGGPMNIGEGYRWNVPVLTYGFDPSFVEFFGSNGVAAVESAIQVLNVLPPASTINLSNYMLNTSRVNHRAEGMNLLDLKSAALGLLIEQMGLTQPTRYVFCLRDFTNPTNYSTIMRNFDPETLVASSSVNGTQYAANLIYVASRPVADLVEFQINPADSIYSAIADYPVVASYTGSFYGGLTGDDVGGWRYLYSPNNLAMENLIPGIRGVGTNAGSYVGTALRPGVDKITFQRLDYDSSSQTFVSVTNQFVDSYISNNAIQQQMLERVVTEPDFLFTAFNLAPNTAPRTGTSNWANNGAPLHDGPGVIQPPVKIDFTRFGPALYHTQDDVYASGYFSSGALWGSFDGTTNAPIAYPIPAVTTNFTQFDFWLNSLGPNPGRHWSWNLVGQPNDVFLLQESTDLTNWFTITSITNLGWNFAYVDQNFATSSGELGFQLVFPPKHFFRTIPQ
jgi:hypothetical protein